MQSFVARQSDSCQQTRGGDKNPLIYGFGATDSRHYDALTKNIFRFLPITLKPEDTKRYHGIDERISIEDYQRCVRFYAQLIRNSNR